MRLHMIVFATAGCSGKPDGISIFDGAADVCGGVALQTCVAEHTTGFSLAQKRKSILSDTLVALTAM